MNTTNPVLGTPLGAYYFSSVQRYKTFFQDYRVTSDDLIGINDGEEEKRDTEDARVE
jgi:hypothetical protein